MDWLGLKLLFALLILGVSIAFGFTPLRQARLQPEHPLLALGETLGGGVFLGIALFHMLPDAEKGFYLAFGNTNYPYANLLCALGFVLLLFLEKIILRIVERAPTHGAKPMSSVPYVLPSVLTIHALTEGTALGINTAFSDITLIFIAIIVHKGSESFALAINLGNSHLRLAHAFILFFIWALMSPIGVLLGTILSTHLQTRAGEITAATFNAFAAGTFLYLATLHKTTHLRSHQHIGQFSEFVVFLLGLGLMAAVEVWV